RAGKSRGSALVRTLTPARSLLRNFQLLQLRQHVLGRRRGLHRLVDRGDLAVLVDVEGPALGDAAGAEYAVFPGHLLVRIAEDREVGVLRLGEGLVALLAFDLVD